MRFSSFIFPFSFVGVIGGGEERKVNPIMSSLRARLRLKPMPLNMVHDADGLPRIILTDPTGSSAEVITLSP